MCGLGIATIRGPTVKLTTNSTLAMLRAATTGGSMDTTTAGIVGRRVPEQGRAQEDVPVTTSPATSAATRTRMLTAITRANETAGGGLPTTATDSPGSHRQGWVAGATFSFGSTLGHWTERSLERCDTLGP